MVVSTDLSALAAHVLGLGGDGHGLDGEQQLVELGDVEPAPQDGLWGQGQGNMAVAST